MLKFSNLAIGVKLGLMSGLGILFVVGMIVTNFVMAGQAKTANDNADGQAAIAEGIIATTASLRFVEMAVKDIRISREVADVETALKDLDERMLDLRNKAKDILPRFKSPANRQRLEKIVEMSENYAAMGRQVADGKRAFLVEKAKVSASEADSDKSLQELDQKQLKIARSAAVVASDIEKLMVEARSVAENFRGKAQNEADAAERVQQAVSHTLEAAVILVLLLSALMGVTMIARPLRALVEPLAAVSAGNFTVAVPGTGRKDEVGQIADAVHGMAQKMSQTIAEIKASGREVTNASAEIATSTTDLSQRTEEQAASLEETSAAMEELAATVRKNAENAQLANQDAATTREVADRGGQVVAKAVDAMARIEESSRRISDIIGVIDEIARQTNLLALNAAVEAARAGEAGRGFAVVASEVRSLAQRSSQAAKDIKDLITNSNGQVKDGVDLVNRAGHSLNEIVESINKVAVVVSEIANASAEQATGIDQINKALTQMDEVTQQNSALVEENAATAKTLEHQAKAMDDQVAVFQIGDAGPSSTVATKPVVAKPVASRPAAPRGVAKPAVKPVADARGMQTALATAVGQDWQEF